MSRYKKLNAEAVRPVRAARLQRGWTQSDLAANAGLSLATVKRLESGADVALSAYLAALDALSCQWLMAVPHDLSAGRRQRVRRTRRMPSLEKVRHDWALLLSPRQATARDQETWLGRVLRAIQILGPDVLEWPADGKAASRAGYLHELMAFAVGRRNPWLAGQLRAAAGRHHRTVLHTRLDYRRSTDELAAFWGLKPQGLEPRRARQLAEAGAA